MFLSIKNLGKIETADIEIDAITVIAGENNSGKSTIGKALFCIFNSFYAVDKNIMAERESAISRVIEYAYHNATDRLTRRFDFDELAEAIASNINAYENNSSLLQEEIKNYILENDPHFEAYINKIKLEDIAKDIIGRATISDEEMLLTIMRKNMQAVFNMEINNVYRPGEATEMKLKIKDVSVDVRVRNNINIELLNKLTLNTEAIYLDDPYAMDNYRYMPHRAVRHLSLRELRAGRYMSHREHLRMWLSKQSSSTAIDEIITTRKLNKAFEKLDVVCPGKMVLKNRRSFVYVEGDSEAVSIDIANVSTGLKAFAIIKTLLLNGALEDNGTIILDEPEIHLHPEWQLLFAELIVLIQKEFNMHILLNTHSPYFLNAIEVYTHKHGISSKCRYYLAENTGATSIIKDVSDNIEEIYQKLARPLQVLENERYAND